MLQKLFFLLFLINVHSQPVFLGQKHALSKLINTQNKENNQMVSFSYKEGMTSLRMEEIAGSVIYTCWENILIYTRY